MLYKQATQMQQSFHVGQPSGSQMLHSQRAGKAFGKRATSLGNPFFQHSGAAPFKNTALQTALPNDVSFDEKRFIQVAPIRTRRKGKNGSKAEAATRDSGSLSKSPSEMSGD